MNFVFLFIVCVECLYISLVCVFVLCEFPFLMYCVYGVFVCLSVCGVCLCFDRLVLMFCVFFGVFLCFVCVLCVCA